MSRQYTYEEVRKALQESIDSMTPREHFERMVQTGIINRKGEVTKLVGGDAEPEPGARRPDDAVPVNGHGE